MLKKIVRDVTRGSALYSPLRDGYRLLFNRGFRVRREQAISFYAQFVSKGDLVFDVGANIGEYAEMFVDLGARVVAIEPNPECAVLLEKIRPRESVTIEVAALGQAKSEGTLHLCSQNTLSTMSEEWLDTAQHIPDFAAKQWDRTVKVPITTLDDLIQKHGVPKFIKIDVEGYEQHVLSGLTRLPVSLSFEFHSESSAMAAACMRENCFASDDQFNLTIGNAFGRKPQPLQFALSEWVPGEEIIRQLNAESLRRPGIYGEIFVRHASRPQPPSKMDAVGS